MSKDSNDTNQIHQRAQMLVMAKLVDAKNQVRDLQAWMRIQFVVVILAICVTIGILALYAIGAPIPYITLTSIFITLALWVKYCMLSYHCAYQCKQLERAQHAMHTLANHHYTQEQHASIVRKRA